MKAILAVSAGVVILAAGGLYWWTNRTPVQQPSAYANPSTCAQCHPAIAATYRKTGMGRSFRKIRNKEDIGAEVPAKPFYHAPSASYFQMQYRDDAWYQRRWQTGFDGKETNVDEKRVDYIMGSGNHSRTFLHW